MNKEQILKTIRSLAMSQGFYGRLLRDLNNYPEWLNELEEQHFNTPLDMRTPSYTDAGDAAQVKLWNVAIKDQDAQALANQDMLLVHFYAGTASTPFAERYPNCMVEITGLGGEGGGNIGMPITVTFGGTRVTGTASRDASTGVVTFSADT